MSQGWGWGWDMVGSAWTPASPTSSGGVTPEHWYRSDGPLWQDAGVTAATADGAVVGRWEDKTANADHVNQTTAGNKPTLQNGVGDLLNGHEVIRGDGANDYLQGTFTTGGAVAQPYTILAVAKLDATAVNDNARHNIVANSAAGGIMACQYQTPAPDEWALWAGNWLTGSASDSDWNIWTILCNGASSQFWHNGISEAAGLAGNNGIVGFTVFSDNGGTSNWKGDIAEIIVYASNLSTADKNQVGEYLAARYGLGYTDI